MRKERIVLATVAVSAMLAASPVGVGAGKPNLTEAERAERAVKRAERIAAAGGFVHSETQGPVIRVVSCQNRMPAKEIEKVVSDMRLLLKLHVSFEMADPMVDAASASKDKNTACYIQIIDKIGDPALTIIPEESRSRVNIAPLMEGVDIEKAAIRVRREVWRSFGYIFGAPVDRIGAMVPVRSLKALDAIGTEQISPMAIMVTLEQCKRLGMLPPRKAIYRKACQEGWAPLPTNDVQRAIWAQVKADKERGPTNPVTIVPPNKKK